MAGFIPVPIRSLTVKQAQRCTLIKLRTRQGGNDKIISVLNPRFRIVPGGQQIHIRDGIRSYGEGTMVVALLTDY